MCYFCSVEYSNIVNNRLHIALIFTFSYVKSVFIVLTVQGTLFKVKIINFSLLTFLKVRLVRQTRSF